MNLIREFRELLEQCNHNHKPALYQQKVDTFALQVHMYRKKNDKHYFENAVTTAEPGTPCCSMYFCPLFESMARFKHLTGKSHEPDQTMHILKVTAQNDFITPTEICSDLSPIGKHPFYDGCFRTYKLPFSHEYVAIF